MGEGTTEVLKAKGPEDYPGEIRSHQAPALPLASPSCSIRSRFPWNLRGMPLIEPYDPCTSFLIGEKAGTELSMGNVPTNDMECINLHK